MGARPTLALSDLHLGRNHSRIREPEALRPLVDGFERVMLLGDIIDDWYVSPQQAREYEERIYETCRRAGVAEVQWFRGNHDANTPDGAEYALLSGVLYLHGHALYHRLKPVGAPDERMRELNARKFGPHRRASRMDKPHWTLIEKAYERIPQRWAAPVAWNPMMKRRARQLAEEIAGREPVRALVFGHTHVPGVREARGLRLVNLGGWMKNTQACGFVREGERAKLVQICNEGQPRWAKTLVELSLPL